VSQKQKKKTFPNQEANYLRALGPEADKSEQESDYNLK